jgi:hypothetical protein
MFKKIVSNLPFSPALVGQLGIYSKKLRKEKATRQLTLMFVVFFIIVQSMILFQPPTSANANSLSSSQTCLVNSQLQSSGLLCDSNAIKTITAINTSQGFVDASALTVNAGDQISYTIAINNPNSSPISTTLQDNISDILDYSTLIDNGGGVIDETTGILYWPNTVLSMHEKQTRTFTVRLFNSIPSTAQGVNNSKSYDCIISNSFGNSIDINVDCPTPKVVEKIVTNLPKIGIIGNIIFSCIVLIISVYLFINSNQLNKEIHIIRKNTNAGVI